MEDTPAITEAAPSSAAPNVADTNSQPAPGALSIGQIDTSKLTLEQLDGLLTGGNVEIPLKSGGEGDAPAPAPAASAAPTLTGEQPSEVAAPATVEGQEPIQEVVETRSQEDIDAAAQAARELAASQGLDEAAQQAAAEAAAQPPEPAVEPVIEPTPKPIERPRFKDERDQLIAGVYQHAKSSGHPISWADAEARVDGPRVEPVQVAPPVDLGKAVTDLKTELAEVTSQLETAGDQLSNVELRNLQRRQTQLDTKIELAEDKLEKATVRAKELAQQARDKSQQQRDVAYNTALQIYPDAGDDTTPLGQAIATRVEAMKDPMHPDHKILEADSAPLAVARLVAAEMGIAPKSKAASVKGPATPPVKPSVVTPPPRAVMSPAPGNKTAVQPAQPVEDAKSQLKRVMTEGTLEELDAIQGGSNTTGALASLVR